MSRAQRLEAMRTNTLRTAVLPPARASTSGGCALLIGSPEAPCARLLAQAAAAAGLEVRHARDRIEALEAAASLAPATGRFDLVVALDAPSLAVAARLRASGDALAVLAVAPPGLQRADRGGFESAADGVVEAAAGAHDAQAALAQVLARVRRMRGDTFAGEHPAARPLLAFGDVRLDAGSGEVRVGEHPLALGFGATAVLRRLLAAGSQRVRARDLIDAGEGIDSEAAVLRAVRQVRTALARAGSRVEVAGSGGAFFWLQPRQA